MIASPPPTAPCRASLLFREMRVAAGGAAWNRIAETVAVGSVTISGLSGRARLVGDLERGRYGQNFEMTQMGPSAEVFDGSTVWSQDVSGGVHPLDAAFVRERAVTDAYLTRRGYLEESSSATSSCLGTRGGAEGQLIIVRVHPKGGIPAVLAVDARTDLLASVSERLPTTTSLTSYGDYRQVGGVVLPFLISSGTLAEPSDGFSVRVDRYVLKTRSNPRDFARPVASNPATMLGGAASTTVPIRIEGRQLLVWASIDGHAAKPFILDTGGHAILTTLAAKDLGLRGAGAGVSGGSGAGTVALQYTPVRSLQIGDAELHDQRFLIIGYPFSFYDRGRKTPLAGILGLEIFERFAVRIDYGRRRLTLTPLTTYVHRGDGLGVPIRFQEDMPMTEAAADGHGGLFGVDTGNAGTVILFGAFLDATHITRAYPQGVLARGSGTGGSDSGRVIFLRRFTFGQRTFTKVPTFLTHMRSGSFSSRTEAGNFGYEILARFVPTFDYASETLYLDSGPFTGPPPRNRAGFACGREQPGPLVVEVVRPGSIAADAGIVVGDRITEVNGDPAEWFSGADMYDMTTRANGTAVHLRVVHGTATKNVTLILR
jgi:hypothetical protein